MDDTSEVRADCGELMDLPVRVAVGSNLLEPAPKYRPGIKDQLISGINFAARQQICVLNGEVDVFLCELGRSSKRDP